jgi:hypothetical protein
MSKNIRVLGSTIPFLTPGVRVGEVVPANKGAEAILEDFKFAYGRLLCSWGTMWQCLA